MNTMLCGCGRRLRAANYEELEAQVIEHPTRDHPELKFGEVGVRAVRAKKVVGEESQGS
jgi:predicted small metal-binding protein